MPKHTVNAEVFAFAAACLLGLPLLPFAPAALGVWCYSLAGRDGLPVSRVKQVRLSLVMFAILSALCELHWGHDVITDYGDVWFDNLFAGLIVPGSIVFLSTILLWIVRDVGALRYRHYHPDE